MKNTMKYLLAIAFLLSTVWTSAINYPVFHSGHRDSKSSTVVVTTPLYHSQTSVSADVSSGSQVYSEMGFGRISTVPTIGADGTANTPGRNARRMTLDDEEDDGSDIWTEEDEEQNTTNQLPLGSPLIPLVLFAMGYAVVSYYRSRRKAA